MRRLKSPPDSHGGRLPPALDDLITHADLTREVFVCPSGTGELATGATTQEVVNHFRKNPIHCSYPDVGAGLIAATLRPQHVLAYEPLSNHAGHKEGDGINVLYGDGTVQWVAKPQAERIVAEL